MAANWPRSAAPFWPPTACSWARRHGETNWRVRYWPTSPRPSLRPRRRPHARCTRRARRAPTPDHGVRWKPSRAINLLVQFRQADRRDTRVPVMLEMVADVARQDEERLEPGRNRGAGDRVFFFFALHGAVLADQADVLRGDMPGADTARANTRGSPTRRRRGQGSGDRPRRKRAARRTSNAARERGRLPTTPLTIQRYR